MYKRIFLGMAACAALVACSSDDGPDSPDNQGSETYAVIRLVNANSGGSRGTEGNPAFEDGTSGESAVKDVQFYFYTADGSYMTKSDLVTNLTWTANSDPNITSSSNVVAVLHGLTNKVTPRFVVAVLNKPANLSLEGMTLDQAKSLTANVALTNGEGNFVMTNSTYDNGNAISKHFATVVNEENFLKEKPTTETLDAAHAISIYVERLAAKTSLSLDFKASNGKPVQSVDADGKINIGEYTVNGIATQVNIVIDGWGLNYTNPVSYLFKNVPEYNTNDFGNFDWWTAPKNYFRSYWATSAYGTLEKISLLKKDQNGTLVSALNNATNGTPGTDPIYCMENTGVVYTDMPSFLSSVTSILVPAHISSVAAGQTEPNWYRYAGKLYNETNFAAQIVNWAKQTYFKDAAKTEVDAGCFQFVPKTGEQGIVEVKVADDAILYDANGQQVTHGMVNAALATSFANISQFANGMMYYNIPIEHLRGGKYLTDAREFNTGAGKGSYGVVRNHAYKVAINSIWNLGSPLNNDDPITPSESTEYYIGATINILAWHVVSQGVDL